MRTVVTVATLGLAFGLGLAVGGSAKDAEKVTGIGGVFFKAKDPKATAAWYAKHLGVPVLTEEGRTTEATFLWKEADAPHTSARTVWSVFPADSNYYDADFMINYRVRDLDALLAQLKAAGVPMVGEPESYPFGKFAWVTDPDGRKVELWQPMGE